MGKKYGLGIGETRPRVGLIAQQVQPWIPEIVTPAPFDRGPGGTSRSGQNYLTIQYPKLVPVLVEAIKEQQRQVRALMNDIGLPLE